MKRLELLPLKNTPGVFLMCANQADVNDIYAVLVKDVEESQWKWVGYSGFWLEDGGLLDFIGGNLPNLVEAMERLKDEEH